MRRGLGRCLGAGRLSTLLSRGVITTTTTAEPLAAALNAKEAVCIRVNGREVLVEAGSTVLEACGGLGIEVPTLCSHHTLPRAPAHCMVCQCTIDGKLAPSCSTPVWEGMEVVTDSAKVREGRRSVLAFMEANHPADCLTCDSNGRCEFQDLASRYNVKGLLPKMCSPRAKQAAHFLDDPNRHPDKGTAAISIDLDKCIKCERCVAACGFTQSMNVLGMAGRGENRRPAVLTEALDLSNCIGCGQCSAVCPVGAITERSEWREVMQELESKRKVMVIMMAPSIRVAIGEELGLAPGAITTGQIATAQRALGFDYVFDANFSADLTIMEEGTELLQRLRQAWGLALPAGADVEGQAHAHEQGPLPMFTSCCPAWVNYVEQSDPDWIPHLSTCKSPMGMLGAVVKRYMSAKLNLAPEDVCLVGVFPCTAKKDEAGRQELQRAGEGRDVDFVLTTREFGKLLRAKRIPLGSLPEGEFDDPLGQGTGAAVIFGNTGGVMEAALRTAYEIAVGEPLPKLEVNAVRGLTGIKEATITLPESAPAGVAGRQLRVAVASGIKSAQALLARMKAGEAEYDFVEVMSCPGGCVGGGGQPKTQDPQALAKRAAAIYSIDERATLRKSHDNPSIKLIYEDFFGQPGGHLSHELLHTTYTDRSGRAAHTRRAAAAAASSAEEPAMVA